MPSRLPGFLLETRINSPPIILRFCFGVSNIFQVTGEETVCSIHVYQVSVQLIFRKFQPPLPIHPCVLTHGSHASSQTSLSPMAFSNEGCQLQSCPHHRNSANNTFRSPTWRRINSAWSLTKFVILQFASALQVSNTKRLSQPPLSLPHHP